MSSAAAPASPAVVRTSSTSRRSGDRPNRSNSSQVRPSSHAPAPTPARHHQPALNNVTRRDHEQSNLAQDHHPPSRRSEDPSRPDSSRRSHSRYASDASTASAMPINGVAVDARTVHQQPVNKRRTTITAPATGTWALGKTIGAGSMGKVKLAKNVDTGEQVRPFARRPQGPTPIGLAHGPLLRLLTMHPPLLTHPPSRPPSRLCLASRRTSTRALLTASEPTTPKKSAPPERPPSLAS